MTMNLINTAILLLVLLFLVHSFATASLDRDIEETFAQADFRYNYAQHLWCVDAQLRAPPGQTIGGCWPNLRLAEMQILREAAHQNSTEPIPISFETNVTDGRARRAGLELAGIHFNRINIGDFYFTQTFHFKGEQMSEAIKAVMLDMTEERRERFSRVSLKIYQIVRNELESPMEGHAVLQMLMQIFEEKYDIKGTIMLKSETEKIQ